MGIRNGLRQSRVVTFGVMAAIAWTALVAYQVAGSVQWLSWSGGYVGQNSAAGIVGVVVLALSLGLLVTLYAEGTESEPSPEPWPPE